MSTRLRFLGAAGYEVLTPTRRFLIDPFLTGNPVAPYGPDDLEPPDAILVTHAAYDHVGDTLTIRLNERTNASKSSSTSTSKSTSIDMPGPIVGGRPVTANGVEILNTQVDNNSEFDGEGDSSQSNRLEGEISVTVAQRLANGNLLVRGQKWIAINQGQEYVRIQGIVRPIDIDPDNSISSLKVADAQISYGANGALADANKPGLLARFFNAPWMPF